MRFTCMRCDNHHGDAVQPLRGRVLQGAAGMSSEERRGLLEILGSMGCSLHSVSFG